jgi:hypothetical protein
MNKLTDFQDFVMTANARVADQGWRLGQALMNSLSVDLLKKYSGGDFDCFQDDSLVGKFLNEVYDDFKPKTVEAIVWSKEPRWYKRHVMLDCSIVDTRGMTSGELTEHIVEYIDVLDVEEVEGYEEEYDIANINSNL